MCCWRALGGYPFTVESVEREQAPGVPIEHGQHGLKEKRQVNTWTFVCWFEKMMVSMG